MTVFNEQVWRCDVQFRIRMDPGTLSILSTIATIGGGLVSAVGAMQNAQAQSDADAYNAQVAQNNAIAVQQQAEQNAELQQQTAKRAIGSTVAAYGSSGVASGEGSALDVLSNTASSAELDRQTILYKGHLQALGYQDEAALDKAKGANAASQGLESAAGYILGTGAKVATKFGSSDDLSGSPTAASNSSLAVRGQQFISSIPLD